MLPDTVTLPQGEIEEIQEEVERKLKLRVLISAFACHPRGSSGLGSGEDILGWNLVKQIGRFHEAWVLAHSQNRAGIEEVMRVEPCTNIHYYYVDLPPWLAPLQRFRGGIQLYAYLWQVKAYFVARRLHRQFDFDVFHHVTYANDWMASFIGALLPVPFIRGPGGALRTPRGFQGEYSVQGRLWEWFRLLGQRALRHDPFFTMGQRRARAILLCNRESMTKIPSKWQHKVFLFPVNGISSRDLALLNSSAEPDREFLILSAGKLLRWKGFTLALKGFRMFAGIHTEAELEIIGDGPDRSHLRHLVRQLQLHGQVRFCEWMPREEFLTRMGSCDVFLFPSLRDGGGAVVVEALAAGKPVVCLDVGGPALHVTDVCGIKVAPRSRDQAIREIAEALERLYVDKELRRRMGRAARDRAERFYLWDRLGERLMKIYEETLEAFKAESRSGESPTRRLRPDGSSQR